MQIDPADYRVAVERARANLASAQANLDLEQARSDQAQKDWNSFGKPGKPSDLLLNIPQLNGAKASLNAAQADLKKAERDLAKTEVKAPFDGTVISKQVGFGAILDHRQSGRANCRHSGGHGPTSFKQPRLVPTQIECRNAERKTDDGVFLHGRSKPSHSRPNHPSGVQQGQPHFDELCGGGGGQALQSWLVVQHLFGRLHPGTQCARCLRHSQRLDDAE